MEVYILVPLYWSNFGAETPNIEEIKIRFPKPWFLNCLIILWEKIIVPPSWEFKSKFVKRYCEAGQLIQKALEEYSSEVRDNKFPAQENFYAIKEEELEKLLGDSSWKYEKLRVENLAKPGHSLTPKTAKK